MSDPVVESAKRWHGLYEATRRRLRDNPDLPVHQVSAAYEERDLYHLMWLSSELALARAQGYRMAVGDGDHVPRT